MICCKRFEFFMKVLKEHFDGDIDFTNTKKAFGHDKGLFGLGFVNEKHQYGFMPINFCPECGKEIREDKK